MVPTRRAVLGSVAASLCLVGCTSEDGDPTASASPTARSTTRGPTPTVVSTPGTTSQPEPSTTNGPGTTTDESPQSDPAYIDHDSFSETTLSLSGPGECSLGATLALPEESGPVPGVVIVHGSGPQDRNGSVGPFTPYADIARGLATRGIAVLRYDKRTLACRSAMDPAEITVDDVVTDDALTAVSRLRGHGRVDPGSVVVAGHSFGGALAPRIAGRDAELAGIAMLAANARPLPLVGVEQARRLLERQGQLSDAQEERLDAQREQAEALANGTVDPGEVPPGTGLPFWESLADYDQQVAVTEVSAPIFLAQGERDRQVFVDTGFARWREILGNRSDVRFETYPEANHYFVPGPAPTQLWGDPVEAEHVLETLVADVAEWVDAVT